MFFGSTRRLLQPITGPIPLGVEQRRLPEPGRRGARPGCRRLRCLAALRMGAARSTGASGSSVQAVRSRGSSGGTGSRGAFQQPRLMVPRTAWGPGPLRVPWNARSGVGERRRRHEGVPGLAKKLHPDKRAGATEDPSNPQLVYGVLGDAEPQPVRPVRDRQRHIPRWSRCRTTRRSRGSRRPTGRRRQGGGAKGAAAGRRATATATTPPRTPPMGSGGATPPPDAPRPATASGRADGRRPAGAAAGSCDQWSDEDEDAGVVREEEEAGSRGGTAGARGGAAGGWRSADGGR